MRCSQTFVRALLASTFLFCACVGEVDGGVGAEETGAIRSSPPFDGDPANGAVFGVDVSIWEGPLAPRELDCFWESGVRHVIVGTQVEEVTRQQLAVSVARGMTVDAYVYLVWDRDVAAQVETAFARAAGFPIGAMWLDVEEAPGDLDATELVSRVEAGLAACRAHAVTCGIYTGPGFWKTHMADTSALADAPLWYARYNGLPTLAHWADERFGGWTAPTGKQWAEEALCGVGVDKDTIRVEQAPAIVVDRSEAPPPTAPPAPPEPVYPEGGGRVGLDHVKLIVSSVPHATRYQLALERWTGTTFVAWATWTTLDPFKKTYPARNAVYRYRARADNGTGWGPWSAFARFDYGTPSAAPASDTPPPPPPSGALSPDGVTLSGDRVTLVAPAITGADRYELAIEVRADSSFSPYVTYAVLTPTKTFYPQIHGTTYRWRVHGRVGGAWSAWSPWASFELAP
jgi:hypothetical protein